MPVIRPFDPEGVTVKEIRTLLIDYLVALWGKYLFSPVCWPINCTTSIEFLFHGQSIPWDKFEESVVVSDLPAFRDFANFNPHSMPSADVVPLAKAFIENPEFVVFRKPDPP